MIYYTYKTFGETEGIYYTNEQGQMISFILGGNNPEEEAYLAWVAEGNEPLPAQEQA
jgi:hypothetical protein